MRETVDAFEVGKNGEGPFQRVLSVAGTGFGKTIVAAVAAWYARKRWNPPRTLFLADRDNLCNQAMKKIHFATGIVADREQGKHRASLKSEVVVGSVQTMAQPDRLAQWPKDHFGLVIGDEAHLSMSDTWQRVLNHFDQGGARSLGITATAMRSDDRDLWSWWQCKGADKGLFELIELGCLSPITVKTLPLELDATGINTNEEGDFDEEGLTHAIEPAFEAIIDAYEKHGEGRKTLWFLPGIEASKEFARRLNARGHAAMHVDGKTPGRNDILERYEANQFRHLVNAQLLRVGYDCADIECVVILQLTTSAVAYQQMVGRGTRLFPGKFDLLLLDFLWKFDKLGVQRPAALVARSNAEAAAIQRAAERQGVNATDIRKIRELSEDEAVRGLVAQLLERRGDKGRQYDAREAAAVLNAPQLLAYEPQAHWEKMPPTEGQLQALARDGIDTRTIRTRGEAANLITFLMGRRASDGGRLASLPQVVHLRRNGIEHPEQMSREQAKLALDGIFSQIRQ